MFSRRLNRVLEKNKNEVLGLLFRQYPSFIWSDRTTCPEETPAFVFHEVTKETLEPALQYLYENDYHTLTADEYVCRRLRASHNQRTVLLTFDDGHKSLYTVAYPALRRFGMRAVAYLVPGVILKDENSATSNFQASFCTWREIQEMHESGIIDMQSHSMYHHSIAISGKVTDFVRPNLALSFLHTDLAPLTDRYEFVASAPEQYFGMPIYHWGARYGPMPAFRAHPALLATCRDYVTQHGGSRFFHQPNWRRQLQNVFMQFQQNCTGLGLEDHEEQRAAILNDLVESKRTIEQYLPNKEVRHFCYPWYRGSKLAVTLSHEAGYVSNAWGSLLPAFAEGYTPVTPMPRLQPHYLWRLPGKGRHPLKHLIAQRITGIM